MTPEDEVRWSRLQGRRRTAEFVRYLMDLAEQDMREREQRAVLEELMRFQDELPPEWRDESYYDLDSPGDWAPIPDSIAGAIIDMRGVLASWREADGGE